MMLSEIPSIYKKRDVQIVPEAKHENRSQPIYVPTPKDRLTVAIVSLVILVLCEVFMFGATTVLHARIIEWLATLAVILFAVITINVVMALGSSQG
jgi:hypothetical protein